MQYSVVRTVQWINGDDLIDHLYFGDLGGQIFRVDLDNSQKF
jgi:Tfp pilus tip-associated adhesin PilY1